MNEADLVLILFRFSRGFNPMGMFECTDVGAKKLNVEKTVIKKKIAGPKVLHADK